MIRFLRSAVIVYYTVILIRVPQVVKPVIARGVLLYIAPILRVVLLV